MCEPENFHTMVGVFGMVLTIFIAAPRSDGLLFSRDADNLVIRPIESMVDAVTQLAANPAYKPEEVKSAKYETDQLGSRSRRSPSLQVGFGEAGNNSWPRTLKGRLCRPDGPRKEASRRVRLLHHRRL